MTPPHDASKDAPRCVFLEDLDAETLALAGGKARGLRRLVDMGLRVPPAFVVLGATDTRSPPDLDACLAALGDVDVAVRSSAIGEDSANASFAGQFETVLGVRGGDAVRRAIRRCLASVHGDRAEAYRDDRHAEGGVVMSIVVQRMVDPMAAGVAFTCDPVTGRRDRLVLDAVAGLGEALVSGSATPDHFHVAPDGRLALRELAGEAPALTDQEVGRIAYEARAAAEEAGEPLDLEWALDAEGTLHWLQARPITHLPADPRELDCRPDPRDVFTRANIGEMMPGAATPLTLSTSALAIDVGIQRLYHRSGVGPKPGGHDFLYVGTFGNHLFLNLSRLMDFSRSMLGAQPDHVAIALVGRPVPELHEGELASTWKRVTTLVRYLYLMAEIPLARVRLARLVESFRPIEERSALAQWEAIDARFHFLGRAYELHHQSTGGAGILAPMLLDRVRGEREATEADHARVAELLAGAENVVSADIAMGIERIVRALCTDAATARSFAFAEDEAALGILRESGAGPLFADYLERHGHRAVREAELRQPEWRADPMPLVRSLKAAVRAELLGAASENRRVGVDPNALGLGMRAMVRLAHAAVRSREHTKSLVMDLTARMKAAYRHLGALLVGEGRLEDADLLYFFTHHELETLCRTGDPGGVQRAEARRRALEVQSSYVFEEVFRGVPEPIPQGSAAEEADGKLSGTPVSPGLARGRARVARTIAEAADVEPGDILISPITDVGWTPYFRVIAGLATDVGSAVSHGSVVAREYGMPAVANLRCATARFRTGDRVLLDGTRGTLELDPDPPTDALAEPKA